MPKYLVNGIVLDTVDQNNCEKLCEFKIERIPGVYEIHKIYVSKIKKYSFYIEETDSEDNRHICAYEITREEAAKLCEKYQAANTFRGFWFPKGYYTEITEFNEPNTKIKDPYKNIRRK